VHAGALSTLMLGLRQVAQAFSVSSTEFSGQTLELTGAGLVSLEDRRLMLELVLDQSLRIVVNIPEEAIPTLQECLLAIGHLRGRLPQAFPNTSH
jgi:hypothetical protein